MELVRVARLTSVAQVGHLAVWSPYTCVAQGREPPAPGPPALSQGTGVWLKQLFHQDTQAEGAMQRGDPTMLEGGGLSPRRRELEGGGKR